MGPITEICDSGGRALNNNIMARREVCFKEDSKRFEDLLATDDLFVEYFNAFLQLPSFPEPLFFNKETGGFEILTDAKKKMVSQIKTAVRSSQKPSKIYKPVKNHSFSDIPLIPMEDGPLTEECEIDTSFMVTTLNKEQGIEWIKAERLPAFLESDCYVEYRLAKLLSQTQISGSPNEFTNIKIDYRPRPRKVQKQEVIDEEVEVDETEVLMKDMYVSMGEAPSVITESWFSEAKMAIQTETTMSSASQPAMSSAPSPSSGIYLSPRRPVSAVVTSNRRQDIAGFGNTALQPGRPGSAFSYRQSDSGFGSPTKSFASAGDMYNSSLLSVIDHEDEGIEDEGEPEPIESKLFSMDCKPITPRSTDTVCLMTDTDSRTHLSSQLVYSKPKLYKSQECLDQSVNEMNGVDDSTIQQSLDVKSNQERESDNVDSGNENGIVFDNIDTLGSVIVGTVLKHACSELTGQDVQDHPVINSLLPEDKYSQIDSQSLQNMTLLLDADEGVKTEPDKPKDADTNNQITNVSETTTTNKNQEKNASDSDSDSLLNSDDDYEESDTFFRKHKERKVELNTKRGIKEFCHFLKGGKGELYWNLWLDIDRGRFITTYDEEQSYLGLMRERYHLYGAPFELNRTIKREFGLIESAKWTMDRLLAVQNRTAEPLLQYWAPRFLLHQNKKAKPEKNFLYHQQVLNSVKHESFPYPATVSLLPLRPKKCAPRINAAPQQITTTQLYDKTIDNAIPDKPPLLKTSPPVGMRRTHCLPDVYQKNLENKEPTVRLSPKVPKDLIVMNQNGDLTTDNIHNNLRDSNEENPFNHRAQTPKGRPSTSRPRSRAQRISSAGPGSRNEGARPVSRVASARPASRASSARLLSRPTSAMQQDRWDNASNVSSMASNHHRAMSRASSASPTPSESEVSEVSSFLGGQRMEGLLQALSQERNAGNFMKKYIERTDNAMWLNCLRFWLELQEYHKLFFAKVFDAFALKKKAQSLHSHFIVYGAAFDINCDKTIRDDIYKKLDPPFEDLFDAAEEYILAVLYDAWCHVLTTDLTTFEKVELIDVKRHLEAKSRYVITLQRRGMIKEILEPAEDPMQDYEDPVYDESLLEKIPKEFLDCTLEKLVHNRIELEHFRQFLADNYASMDLMCWMDIEAFKRIPHSEERRRDVRAKDIKVKYLNKKYFFGPNSPAGKAGQEKVVAAGGGWGKLLEDRPPTAMLLEAQKYVQERLDKKWLPLFLTTEGFAERQKPQALMDDYVDDVMLQRKKKSQAIWKMLESKWVSSSKDIITFRKALLNPITSLHFRKYVSVKGDNLENDVLFWQEVQRYKDLCHNHSEKALVQTKTTAIINCFLDSQIPPSLQIDIPHEQAEKIMDRKLEIAPYLFREAQLTVFRVLFSHWNDFCEFRTNITDDKILPTLERHRRHARKKEREAQQKLEEQREKEAARRKALGLPVDGDEVDDDGHDPFKEVAEKGSGGSEAGEAGSELGEKEHMSWSYSQYMSALDQEHILNNVDESTFSSLMGGGNIEDDKESVHSKTSDEGRSKEDASKIAKRAKSQHNETDSKGKTDSADTGPQTEKRIRSSKGERTVNSRPSSSKPKVTKEQEKVDDLLVPRKPEAQERSHKMHRSMPPLVKQK